MTGGTALAELLLGPPLWVSTGRPGHRLRLVVPPAVPSGRTGRQAAGVEHAERILRADNKCLPPTIWQRYENEVVRSEDSPAVIQVVCSVEHAAGLWRFGFTPIPTIQNYEHATKEEHGADGDDDDQLNAHPRRSLTTLTGRAWQRRFLAASGCRCADQA